MFETASCSYCGTARVDDQAWCAQCFLPFPTEDVATDAAVAEPTVEVPAQPAGEPALAATAHVDAAATAEHGAALPPPDPRFVWSGEPPARPVPPPVLPAAPPRRLGMARHTKLLIAGGAAAVVVALLAAAVHAVMSTGNDKQRIADQFRTAKPLVTAPDLMAGFRTPSADVPDTPANAAAVLAGVDTAIRTANHDLETTAGTFDRWAHGSVTTRELTTATRALGQEMADLSMTLDSAAGQAPESLSVGLSHLSQAAAGYDTSLRALNDYLLSGAGGARMTFFVGVANANQDWDTGLTTSYTAAGLKAPPSPHQR